MKMKTFLVAALATMTLAACSKDADTVKTGGNSKTNFAVSLPGAMETYAVEDPQAAGEITPFYNDVTVYLVDGGDNATRYTWTNEEIIAKTKRFEQIVEPSKVIVIVNAYNTTLPAGPVTVAELETALGALAIADQNKAEKAVTGTTDNNGNAVGDYLSVQQVALYGSAEASEFTTMSPSDAGHEDHIVKEVEVELSSLVSRFEVGTVKKGTGLNSLTVEAVYINYFYNDYGMTVANSQRHTEGTWPETLSPTPGTFSPSWATDSMDPLVTSETGTKAYVYQVFAGNLVPHIIYKVSGEVAAGYKLADGTGDLDDPTPFTNKYITVKGFQIAGSSISSIEAHKIYKMGLDDGGIAIDCDKITDKPEKTQIDLLVAITVAEWTSENVTPEI